MGDMSSMMGGAGGDFGGIDFSKLGGGMDTEEAEDEDEDDEMPELEEEEEKPAASSSKAKIEEVN